MKKLENLKVGDKLLIRRTSGAEQEATVHRWLMTPSSVAYQAPEVVFMQVTFPVNGKPHYKVIAGSDFIKTLS